jgi:hypothetical protein
VFEALAIIGRAHAGPVSDPGSGWPAIGDRLRAGSASPSCSAPAAQSPGRQKWPANLR